jgi:argininosuccinate lyase
MRAIEVGKELNELPAEEFQKFSPLIEADVYEALSLESTLATKRQIGGTAPENVTEALATARKDLAESSPDK